MLSIKAVTIPGCRQRINPGAGKPIGNSTNASIAGPKNKMLTMSMADMWIACRRGKKLQKHYTVILCEVDVATRAAFQPQLNSEHREARWWPLAGLPPPQQMHPVVVCLHSVGSTLSLSILIIYCSRADVTHHAAGLQDGITYAE